MSEYQFYEFRAIDKPLTRQQMDELRSVSSRAEIDEHSFTNEYHYGNFRGNPDKLMQVYFDAHLYVANWGTHTLMFRLPRRLVDVSAFEPYFDGQENVLTVTDDFVIVKFHARLEGGEGWTDGNGLIDDLLPLREDLLAGDLRPLYLAWLSAATGEYRDEEDDATTVEPPVPPGLKKLTTAQKAFANFMWVDSDLLSAAAKQSPALVAEASQAGDLSAWVARQPAARKDAWLLQLLTEEGIGPRREILREFQKSHQKPGSSATGKPRSLAELLGKCEEQQKEREAAEAAAREAEARQQAEVRGRYLDGLVGKEEEMWRQAEAHVESKKSAEYDQAISLLRDLRDLGERQKKLADVRARLAGLQQRHARKSAFVQRMRDAKLID